MQPPAQREIRTLRRLRISQVRVRLDLLLELAQHEPLRTLEDRVQFRLGLRRIADQQVRPGEPHPDLINRVLLFQTVDPVL